MARRTGFLRGAAQPVRSRAGTALVLDAGGFFPEGEVPMRNDPAVARRLTALLRDALARSGAQAIALDHGERDFLEQTAPREARRLREVFLEADPPGTPRVINWGTHRVAIVALEESLTDDAPRVAGSVARAHGDFVIALARGDGFSGRRLARLSGADLVVLSRGARPEAPLLEASSILVGCGIEGKEVGEVRIVLDPGTGGTRSVPRGGGATGDRQIQPVGRPILAAAVSNSVGCPERSTGSLRLQADTLPNVSGTSLSGRWSMKRSADAAT
jgi:hypothetical protein